MGCLGSGLVCEPSTLYVVARRENDTNLLYFTITIMAKTLSAHTEISETNPLGISATDLRILESFEDREEELAQTMLDTNQDWYSRFRAAAVLGHLERAKTMLEWGLVSCLLFKRESLTCVRQYTCRPNVGIRG
jgi:hypothetical protein